MKKYSSKQAKRGKTAYRTPGRVPAAKTIFRVWDRAARLEHRRTRK